jgi:hypothetical protein
MANDGDISNDGQYQYHYSEPTLTQTRTKTYTYNELWDLCNPLIQAAADDKWKSAILAGTIVQLTMLMHDQQIDSEGTRLY